MQNKTGPIRLTIKTIFNFNNEEIKITADNQEKYSHSSGLTYEDLEKYKDKLGFLSDVCLRRADLSKINLEKINMIECKMRRAALVGSNCEFSDFEGSYLDNVNMMCANFSNSNLRNCNLMEIYAIAADFTKAFLENSDLSGANLHKANLTGANLTEANLTGANLTGAYYYDEANEKKLVTKEWLMSKGALNARLSTVSVKEIIDNDINRNQSNKRKLNSIIDYETLNSSKKFKSIKN